MNPSIHLQSASLVAASALAFGPAAAQVTETAASNLVAAFDTTADNVWRDTGPANRSFIHRLGDTSGGVAFNQVAVPVSNVIIAGQPRNVTAAFLAGAAESTGSYGFASQGSASFEIWFEITDTNPDQILFEAGGLGNGVVLGVGGGQLTFHQGGGGSLADEITSPIGTGWHQVVGVIHRDTGTTGNDTLALYLDGALVAESANPVDIGIWAGGNQGGIGRLASSIANALSLVIFSDPAGADGPLPLQGKVAIFRLYNRALTAAEVAEALATGEGPAPPAIETPLLQPEILTPQTRPGIVANPTFEFDATILADTGPWTRTGTAAIENFANPPVYSAAPDPIDDASVPGINAAYDTSSISIAGAQGVSDVYENVTNPQRSRGNGTFEIWAEFNVGPDSGQQILFECGGAGAGTMFSLNNEQFSFFINGQGTGIGNFEILTTLTSGWHQIVGVIENTFDNTANDSMELFINGVSVGSVTDVNINDWAGGNQAGLGNRGGGTHPAESTTFGATADADAPFQGRIAAFRFYNRVLSPAEIQQNFAQIQVPNEVVVPAFPEATLDGISLNGDDALVDFSFSGGLGVKVHRSFDLANFVPVGGTQSVSPFVDAGIRATQERAFYRIELEQTLADFDFGADSFATDESSSGPTSWERGIPAFGPSVFPGGQSTVWATDLDSAYAPETAATLRTDAFDLAGLELAVVRLTHWYDIEDGFPDDIAGIVRLVDASSSAEIAELGRFTGASIGWAFNEFTIPESALGQEARLEFELIANAGANPGFAGWYLQGVRIEALPESP